MKRISTIDLLGIWETCIHYPLVERSLNLLSALYDKDADTIARLSIGERDARLLKFREWIFGSRLINMASCPACKTTVEWETDIEEIKLQEVNQDASLKVLNLNVDSFKIDFRLPNSIDIIQIISDPHPATDAKKLITGCILKIDHDQKVFTPNELPPWIIDAIDSRMDEEDPQADIKMVLICPDCKKQWETPFDILSYLWLEIDSWAKQQLQEVTLLARAFGWSERDILNLGHHRRQIYLEMLS